MAESTFNIKNGSTETPSTFHGKSFRFWTLDAPKNENDYETVFAGIRAATENATSAHALFVSAYNLDRQKTIKDLAAAKDDNGKLVNTPESVQEIASSADFRKSGRKLRGAGTGKSGSSGKTRARIELQAAEKMLADAKEPAIREFLAKQVTELKAKLAAIDAAPAETPATPAPAAPKGSRKQAAK